MKINKVLLLTPRYEKSRYRPVLQTGVGYLAEALLENGIEYKYLDMGFSDSRRDLPAVLRQFNPEFVGISMLTYRYRDHYKLADAVKNILPKTIVSAGGAHASLFGDKILKECPSIDVVFKGESERVLVDLCKGKDKGQIKEADLIDNLDNISFPTYQGFPLDRYIDKELNILPIVSSRGCPYQCSYCPIHLSMGRKFRIRNAKNIVDELEYWYGKGYRRFGISDDNFSFNKKRVYEICDEIDRRDLKDLKLSCDNGIRADCVDYELLERMREVGFWRIAYGVEAGNDRVLKVINKGLTIGGVEKAIQDACKLGYAVRLFFLIGSPCERWSDFKDSLRLAGKYPVYDASFYNVVPYPRTALFGWIEKNGAFIEKSEKYLHYASGRINIPIFETPDFSFRERKRAFNYGQKLNSKIIYKDLKRRLRHFGILGMLAAYFYKYIPVRRLLEIGWLRSLLALPAKKMIKAALNPLEAIKREEYHLALSEKPRVSIIIPSFDGSRKGNVPRLVEEIKNQSFKDLELHVIKGVSPQGKAINLGAKRAKGDILLIMDDDSKLGDAGVIGNLVKVLDEDRNVGMVGAPIVVPRNANWLQRRTAKEFPRFGMPVLDKVIESDMACHGCCAIPRDVFWDVGGERETIIRGLDPDLRYRLRQRGYKVVLASSTWIHHPLPESIGKLIRLSFRNGMGSAYCLVHQPDLIYDTDEFLELKDFNPRTSFLYRLLRFPIRLLRALVEFKLLRSFAYSVYAIGFFYGILKHGCLKQDNS